MTYNVEWETLEYVAGNSNKFYRGYLITKGNQRWSLVQWGSQRASMRTGGQAKLTPGSAMYSTKIDEKRREGYSPVDSGDCQMSDLVLDGKIAADDAKGMCAAIEDAMRQGASQVSAPNTVQAVTCPECAQIFNGRAELENHMRNVHRVSGSAPDAPPVIAKHPVEALAQRALSALGLAAADPHAAMVEAAKIRAELDTELEVVSRVESYLQTLDLLVDEEA